MIVLDREGRRHYYTGGGPLHPSKADAAFIDIPEYRGKNAMFMLDSAKAVCFYSKEKAEALAFQFAVDDRTMIGQLSIGEATWRDPANMVGRVSPGEIKLGVIGEHDGRKI